mmetsp:Transcript_67768/g.195937  ORF Transcript_67768/g.195937 Transcript_67768/m.195937 type:complete len:289 (-) Transcript_67768:375-1241(-)
MRQFGGEGARVAVPAQVATHIVLRLALTSRHIVAALPRMGVLVGVESNDGVVLARGDIKEVPSLGVGVLVVENAEIRHVADAGGVKALLREEILAASHAETLDAPAEVAEKDVDCLRREHLERAHEVELEVDVVQVHRRMGGRSHRSDVHAQPLGEEYRVRVGLHRPVVFPVHASLLHLLPSVPEDVGVGHRLPIALARAPALEDARRIALENAKLLGTHQVEKRLLIPFLHPWGNYALRRHHCEAVEGRAGRVAGLEEHVLAHVPAKLVARPWLLVVEAGVCARLPA